LRAEHRNTRTGPGISRRTLCGAEKGEGAICVKVKEDERTLMVATV
jgi:hypothetical protein